MALHKWSLLVDDGASYLLWKKSASLASEVVLNENRCCHREMIMTQQ